MLHNVLLNKFHSDSFKSATESYDTSFLRARESLDDDTAISEDKSPDGRCDQSASLISNDYSIEEADEEQEDSFFNHDLRKDKMIQFLEGDYTETDVPVLSAVGDRSYDRSYELHEESVAENLEDLHGSKLVNDLHISNGSNACSEDLFDSLSDDRSDPRVMLSGNASPNLSDLMTFQPILSNDTEKAWRRHIQCLLCRVPASLFELFWLLGNVSSKAATLTREACTLLERDAASSNLRSSLMTVWEQLDAHTVPFVWFCSDSISNPGLKEALTFGHLEVQELLETFLDTKDHLAQCVDAVRARANNGIAETEGLAHNELLLVGRALCKLHLQLAMVLEAANKMVGALTTAAKTNQLEDISSEVIWLKAALEGNVEGELHTPTATLTPPPEGGSLTTSKTILMHLLQESRWPPALDWAKQNRGLWSSELIPACSEEDDVINILILYCKDLSNEKSNFYVTTRTEQEFRGAQSALNCSLLKVFEAVKSLETSETATPTTFSK